MGAGGWCRGLVWGSCVGQCQGLAVGRLCGRRALWRAAWGLLWGSNTPTGCGAGQGSGCTGDPTHLVAAPASTAPCALGQRGHGELTGQHRGCQGSQCGWVLSLGAWCEAGGTPAHVGLDLQPPPALAPAGSMCFALLGSPTHAGRAGVGQDGVGLVWVRMVWGGLMWMGMVWIGLMWVSCGVG